MQPRKGRIVRVDYFEGLVPSVLVVDLGGGELVTVQHDRRIPLPKVGQDYEVSNAAA